MIWQRFVWPSSVPYWNKGYENVRDAYTRHIRHPIPIF